MGWLCRRAINTTKALEDGCRLPLLLKIRIPFCKSHQSHQSHQTLLPQKKTMMEPEHHSSHDPYMIFQTLHFWIPCCGCFLEVKTIFETATEFPTDDVLQLRKGSLLHYIHWHRIYGALAFCMAAMVQLTIWLELALLLSLPRTLEHWFIDSLWFIDNVTKNW